jgi:plastocyanin
MAAGVLTTAQPGATTNTRLYSCPIGRTATVVLSVCNTSGSAATYRVALKNYTQVLTLSSSSHTFNTGNPVSSYLLGISPGIRRSEFEPGDTYTSDNSKWNLKVLDVLVDTSTITIPTKVSNITTVSFGTELGGTLAVGNTITDSNNALTAVILGRVTGSLYLDMAATSTAATTIRFVEPYASLGTNKYVSFNYIPTGGTTAEYETFRISAYTAGQYTATVQRAQFGTTARQIVPGQSGTVFTVTATTKTLNEGATLTDSDSTLTLNNVTGLFVGDFLQIGNEFMQVNSVDAGTSSVNVTRGALGSTAATAADGSTVTRVSNDGTVFMNYFALSPVPAAATKNYTVTNNGTTDYVFSGDATGSDPTITVNVGDTVNFAVNAPGHPFHITNTSGAYNLANEVAGVTNQGAINGTVTWDTTGVPTGVYFYVCANHETMQGQIVVQSPNTSPTVTSGAVSARITTNASTVQNQTEFVYDLTNTNKFEWVANTPLTLNANRIYRFTQVDASNTGQPLRFSDSQSGTPLYTTGVTTSGTPGSAGAYSQIDLTASAPNQIFTLSTGTGGVSYGLAFTIDTDPRFTSIYVYDIQPGAPVITETFNSGTTATVTQTINTITSGAYGYVRSFSGTSLKVSLGVNSPSFIATNTFLDTPLGTLTTRTTATVSSVTEVQNNDYVVYDKSLGANTTDKHTGIVVGSGDNILVYSSAATISYVVNGFEDVTNDWTTVHYDLGNT